MMKDFKNFNKKKDHQNLNQRTSIILIFCGFCAPIASFCQGVTDIEASVNGTLNCTNTLVTLSCNIEAQGTNYKWTGPNGYVSTTRKSVTAIPGVYKVSATDPSTGITSTSDVKVTLDTIRPKGVKVTVSGKLTCKDTLITLIGSSATPDVSYKWHGPEGFTSSEKIPETTIPGNYQLTVMNPANGCISKSGIKVLQEINPPENVSATVSGVLTCKNKIVKLAGASSTQNVTYTWTGPHFSGESQVQDVSIPGEYLLEVTDQVNGCSSKAKVTVLQNEETPHELIAVASDTLTCKILSVKLTASSTTKGTIYKWSGPKGITSFESQLITNVPGDYILKATNPENVCSTNKTVTVVQDTTPPENIKVTSSGILTCKTDSIVLSCNTLTNNVEFDWNGPNGFTSKTKSPKVTKIGTYYVEATKTSNGCSVTKSFDVIEDISIPKKVTATSSGIISCLNPDVKLSGKSSTNRVKFVWSGPNNFQSDLQEPIIKFPGKYILTAIDTINGCKNETSIIVSGEVCMKN